MECSFTSDGDSTDNNLTIIMINSIIETSELNGKTLKHPHYCLKLLQKNQQPFQDTILTTLLQQEMIIIQYWMR